MPPSGSRIYLFWYYLFLIVFKPIQCDNIKGSARAMTSERQKAANRANALHSTGPKTPEGTKPWSASTRSGMASSPVTSSSREDADAFEDLWNQVRANFSPVGPIEEFLVERVVNALWRLRRLARAETALFHWRVHAFKADRLTKQVGSYEKTFLDGLSLPGLYSAPEITDKASHAEATEALGQARYERDRDEVLLGRALDADAKEGDAFGKLIRYERSLERSLFRTFDELRQIQGNRQNRPSFPISDAVTADANDTK
jgi:hypothetical protein